ncbi:10665_t:CDS:2 [Dentiscutata heterogama]|uniref:10665_t:CDS:1 n=1 Tax=Dentiscutata heterogama TaxID=1316150 RepID=A0ACA9K112_9GLOM|nr:10665_t:CDS:2 [Dentiscutata heterogama]
MHCQKKTYAIKTSRTHLKKHTLSCFNSPLNETRTEELKPTTKEDVDNSIMDMVIATGASFNILNNPSFRKMVRNLRYVTPSYKIPHSTTISRHITGNIFDLRLKFIKDVLAKTSGQISLTCDGWHSTVHKCHYTVITGSWISDDWKIVNIVLSFQKSGQTAKEITSEIMNTLKNYSIEKKIFALTMDNTTTNKAVNRLLQNELPDTELISIGCMCHILNLIVKEGLKEISILHKEVHKVMKFLANPLASNRIEVLESHCRISGINFLKPILEIDTRWNSTLAMFERYLHLHPAIQEMCSKEPSMPTCLDNESLIVLESFCQLLKPFEIATSVLSKEQSNSISDALTFEHLKATLIEVGGYKDSDAEIFVNDIRKKVHSYGMKYSSTSISDYVEIDDNNENNSTSNSLFPIRRTSKRRKRVDTVEYELELYESESLGDLKNNGIKLWELLLGIKTETKDYDKLSNQR